MDIFGGYDPTEYFLYLKQIAARLPERTREFVFQPGHYGIDHERGLHDSWVESVTFAEESTGKRHEIRTIKIKVTLLGPQHDGFHELIYYGVQKYSLNVRRVARGTVRIGHGDWIIDEVLLRPSGLVSHEVIFSDSGIWKIECEDIEYKWCSKPN